jgi:hypothetical protein
MKKTTLALAIGLGLSIGASSAMAALSFQLTNIPAGWDGAVQIKITNAENFSDYNEDGSPAVGASNYGVFKVTSIIDPTSTNTLWADGAGGAELLGAFSGITVKTSTTSGGNTTVDSTDGTYAIFLNPESSFADAGAFTQGVGGYGITGCSTNENCYDGVSNVAGGSLFLSGNFATVGITSDPSVTVHGTFTSLTNPAVGNAAAYVDVTGGDYQTMFDTNGTLGGSDLSITNNFCTPGADIGSGQTCYLSQAAAGGPIADGGWQLASNDPLSGNVTIPEPATITLMGLGLMGMGFGARRRKQQLG